MKRLLLNNAPLRSSIVILLLVVMAGCNSKSSKRNISTLDSNVSEAPDSVPSIVYLDTSRGDSSFTVAMDSSGPTVEPQDTVAAKKK